MVRPAAFASRASAAAASPPFTPASATASACCAALSSASRLRSPPSLRPALSATVYARTHVLRLTTLARPHSSPHSASAKLAAYRHPCASRLPARSCTQSPAQLAPPCGSGKASEASRSRGEALSLRPCSSLQPPRRSVGSRLADQPWYQRAGQMGGRAWTRSLARSARLRGTQRPIVLRSSGGRESVGCRAAGLGSKGLDVARHVNRMRALVHLDGEPPLALMAAGEAALLLVALAAAKALLEDGVAERGVYHGEAL